jgi:hypothetical protein
MTRTAILSAAFAALLALGLSACASNNSTTTQSPATAKLTAARAKLTSDLEACTAAHGYDPTKATGIAENALAPGELEWRECAYTAARTYARANPAMRLDYELLITDDRSMTAAVQAGTLTRSERRAKLEARLADIRAREQQQLQATEDAAEADHEQLTNTVETMRGFAL